MISLHNSRGACTDIAVGDWNANWGQSGSNSDFVVNTKTVKFLNLVTYQTHEHLADRRHAGRTQHHWQDHQLKFDSTTGRRRCSLDSIYFH